VKSKERVATLVRSERAKDEENRRDTVEDMT